MKNLQNILRSGYWILLSNYYLCPRMKKVMIIDTGETFTADDCREIVSSLKRMNAFTYNLDNNTYMIQYAKRAVLWDNLDIRATDEDVFVEDLMKNNIIEVSLLEKLN